MKNLHGSSNVLPHEVEDVLSGKCRIFKQESGDVEGKIYIMRWQDRKRAISLSIFIKKLNNRALIITAGDNEQEGEIEI